MKQSSGTGNSLRELDRLCSGPIADDAITQLRRALNSSTSLLIAKAAEIVGHRKLEDLIPDMISAFSRLQLDEGKKDKLCLGKTAIANALNAMEYMGDEVFLAGAYYTQREPAFGGPIDAAIKLRVACIFGLARTSHPSAHYVLADLMCDPDHGVNTRFTDPQADPEFEVRAAAAKALTHMGTPETELMLRMKVLAGDKNLEVIGECFTGLMTMSPTRSLDFVARYLNSGNPQMVECAALAIGQSHLPKAFEVLKEAWETNPSPSARIPLLLPMALVRTDDAFDFLLDILYKASSKIAIETLNVLSLYADDTSITRVRTAVSRRTEEDIREMFEKRFGMSAG